MRMRPEEFFYFNSKGVQGDEGRKRTIPLQGLVCYLGIYERGKRQITSDDGEAMIVI
jgi:hypothetical protein